MSDNMFSLRPSKVKGPPQRGFIAPPPPPPREEGLSIKTKRLIGLLVTLFAVANGAISFASSFWGKTQAAAIAYDQLITEHELEETVELLRHEAKIAFDNHRHAPRDIDNIDTAAHPNTERELRRIGKVVDGMSTTLDDHTEVLDAIFEMQVSQAAADLERNRKKKMAAANEAVQEYRRLRTSVKLSPVNARNRILSAGFGAMNTDPRRLY